MKSIEKRILGIYYDLDDIVKATLVTIEHKPIWYTTFCDVFMEIANQFDHNHKGIKQYLKFGNFSNRQNFLPENLTAIKLY